MNIFSFRTLILAIVCLVISDVFCMDDLPEEGDPLVNLIGRNISEQFGFWWHITPASFNPYDASCPVYMSKYACPWNSRSLVLPEQSVVKQFVQKLSSKHVYFIGDSLTRQHFISVVCILQSYITDHDVSWAPEASKTTHSPVPHGKGSFFHKATVNFSNHMKMILVSCVAFDPSCYKDIPDESVVITNFGLWYFGNFTQLISDTHSFAVFALEKHLSNRWTVIWRETPHRHFETTSQYDFWFKPGEEVKYPCIPVDGQNQDEAYYSHLQTKLISNYFRKRAGDDALSIISTLGSSKDQWDMHTGLFPVTNDDTYPSIKGVIKDCTHYCLPGVSDVWTRDLMMMMTID